MKPIVVYNRDEPKIVGAHFTLNFISTQLTENNKFRENKTKFKITSDQPNKIPLFGSILVDNQFYYEC